MTSTAYMNASRLQFRFYITHLHNTKKGLFPSHRFRRQIGTDLFYFSNNKYSFSYKTL